MSLDAAASAADASPRRSADRRGRTGGQQVLARMGEGLGASLDCETTIRTFARLAVEELAEVCVVAVRENETCAARTVVAHRDRRMEDGARSHFERWAPGGLRLLEETMETGVPTLLSGAEAAAAGELGSLRSAGVLTGETVSCIAVPVTGSGQPPSAALFIRSSPGAYGWADLDLAEQVARRAGLALKNARLYAKALQTLKAHDEMLGFISHDLRNPLNVISMAAGLLLDRAAEADGFTRHWLAAILHAAEQMDSYIGDLLEATRTEAGSIALDRRPIAVAMLLREAAASHQHAAELKGLRLEVQPPSDAVRVVVDLHALVRSLSNLIGNAVKFTTAGGTVRVTAEPAGDRVRFEVADTGVGIRDEDLPHIFDRFWRAPGLERSGAGLGLAIVKSAIEAHGGEVRVESRFGHGSTFSFAIPCAAEAGGGPDSTPEGSDDE